MFSNLLRGSFTRPDGSAAPAPGRLEFAARGVPVPYLNALRRCVMRDVKTAAFAFDPSDPAAQDILFEKNTGVLHNEFMGQRVSLVPICLSRDELAQFEPERCTFTLAVDNAGTKPLDVTTADIVVSQAYGTPASRLLNRDKLFPADPISKDHVLLTTLMPKTGGAAQGLHFRARASFGSGSRHARWCPVAAIGFVPRVDEAEAAAQAKTALDKHRFDTIDRFSIYQRDVDDNAIDNEFFLESACGMTPEDIVAEGLNAVSQRMRAIANSTDNEEAVSLMGDRPGENMYGIVLHGQDSSVGELIQYELLLSGKTEFAGYYKHHTATDAIILSIKTTETDVLGLLQRTCDVVARRSEALSSIWAATVAGGKVPPEAAALFSGKNGAARARSEGEPGDAVKKTKTKKKAAVEAAVEAVEAVEAAVEAKKAAPKRVRKPKKAREAEPA